MGPNAGEPGNLGGAGVIGDKSPIASAVPSVEPTVPVPDNSIKNSSSFNSLGNLEKALNAAKQAVEAQAGTSAITSQEEFKAKSESGGATMPFVNAPKEEPVLTDVRPSVGPDLKPEISTDAPVAQLDPSIGTINKLLKDEPQTVQTPQSMSEVVPQAEKIPGEKLMKEIAAIVEKYDVKEKVAA
jgi:hypothetical protein